MVDITAPAELIPTPPDFPIAWEQPGDEQVTWRLDQIHLPNPITPLVDSFLRRACQIGFNRAMARYSTPLRAMARRFNTYHYLVTSPATLAADELSRMGEEAQRRVGEAMRYQMVDWRVTWLPAIKRELAVLANFDLAGASDAALLAHLNSLMPRWERLWDIHFGLGLVFLPAMSYFQDIYRDLLGADDEFDALRLLQGFENETLRTNRALWRLAQSARAARHVREIVETVPAAAIREALASSPEGLAFRAELEEFLHEFGKRGNDFFDLDRPSWLEDPTPALVALRAFLASDAADPEEERQRLAESRERLLAATRQRLQGYPQQAVEQFEFLLKAAQEGTILSEDHGFYIDWQASYEVRRVLLEAGRRLAALGAIDVRDDVFYLSFDELRAALANQGADRHQDEVAARKAEMTHFARITPPRYVGAIPTGSPPDDPLARAGLRFQGGPVAQSESQDVLHGHAGSPGKVVGRARIIRTLAEAHTLRPGDILVATTTTPPWTPLFATVAAVVTDTGGVLSHSAVVAREYSLPAVVGTGVATTAIRDGQMIAVDGTEGTVRLIAD